MTHPFKIAGAIVLVATAACSTDPISPNNASPVSARADVRDASTHNVVVTESDIAREQEDALPLRNWVFYYRILATSTGVFVTGPGDPPLGVGSFELSTPTDGDKGTLFNFDHAGTRLADITTISYATYRDPSSTPGVALPSINIQIDKNGGAFVTGDFMTLVYEPYLNGATIEDGVWQTWNTIPGTWWATRPFTRTNGTLCAPQVCTVSWSEIVAAMPNATILGGFGVNQGSFNGGLLAATDALTIGHNGSTWIYNFEPLRANKHDCKKDDREDMKDGGSPHKNKGDCGKHEGQGSDEN